MAPPLKARLTRLRYGFETLLGLKQHGFFIPYRHAGGTAEWRQREYDALAAVFNAARPQFEEFIGIIDSYAEDLEAISGLKPPQPRFEQDWFPRLDACAHYAMVRHHNPARIVEVGSGHSTRFMARAARDGGLGTRIHAIDPAPRADLASLDLSLDRRTLQEADHEVFADLQAGDFCCVDSSHILMPGSDVDIMLNQVLPRLPAGVFVFFHDIFLPQNYPDEWPFTIYNEQNGVAVLLQSGYRPVFSSAYALKNMAGALDKTVVGRLPVVEGGVECGLWLQKTAGSAGG